MAKSIDVLFLAGNGRLEGRAAELLFNAAVRKFGLGRSSTSRVVALAEASPADNSATKSLKKALLARGFRDAEITLPMATLSEADLPSASLVVALADDGLRTFLQSHDAMSAETWAFWPVVPPNDALSALEHEVSNLIARLLGGQSSERSSSERETAPARTAAKPVTVKIGRETKGRRGKGVTTISELPLDETVLSELATLLKTRCGTGGTVRDGRIEIQGDQRDRLTAELEKLGYRVKRAGG